MAIVSESGIATEPVLAEPAGLAERAAAIEGRDPAHFSKWYRLRQDGTALVQYLLDSEVHTYAFSVAANAILSFIPLIVLLFTLAHSVFHSQVMVGAVSDMVGYFLPAATTTRNWVATNIQLYADYSTRHGVQFVSLVMILISCTGIFLPLEVALNQAWGVAKSRNYLLNQAVAFGLAVWMVVLGMCSVGLSAAQREIFAFLFRHWADNWFFASISAMWLTLCGGAASILFFFSIYWLLPNCKVPARSVMRASVVTGLLWLASRWIFAAVLPYLDLKDLYGPFYISVGLLLWGYISGLILFAGAQFSVKRMGTGK